MSLSVSKTCAWLHLKDQGGGGEATAVLISCLELCSLVGKIELFLYCESVDAKGIRVT